MEVYVNRQEKIDQIISSLMSHESHLSYSSLSAFKKSPSSFIDYKLGMKEETDAMVYGSMVHTLILEPQDFDNRYFTLDDATICSQIGGAKPRATKAYKEWFATETASAGDKMIVDPQDYRHAQLVASNVKHNRASAKVLALTPEHEQPIEWEYKNFKFKGFIDGLGDGAINDLKTCPDASPSEFKRTIVKRGYYLQAVMYIYAKGKMLDYYITAVDKMGGVSVHKLDINLLQYGMEEYARLVESFNECILTDSFEQSFDYWSTRFDGIFMAEKPGYLY